MKEPFRLDGEVAVITGGARGIGRAIAETFVARGAAVVLADIDLDAAERTAAEIVRKGGAATGCHLDVTDEAEAVSVMDAVAARQGRIDILVNNAGTSARVPTFDLPSETWQRVVDINLSGTFYCARAAAKHMIAAGGGRIVNIASMFGLSGGFFPNASYQASKGGVVNLTRALAVEWAKDGVTVNAVGPALVRTDLTANIKQEHVDLLNSVTPLGIDIDASDVAFAVLYLASHEARKITGHTLPVDAGFLAH
jgi:NAD(P)-dependent dehydrogenase (short-subunit alcohol dehydrogenase family)